MKKTALLLALVASSLLFFTSCDNKKKNEEKQQLQGKIDSMQRVIDTQSQEVSDFIASFLEIQEALNVIKQKENLVAINSSDATEVSTNPDVRESIHQDIRDIYQLLLTNKQKVKELRSSLNKSNDKVNQYEALVKSLEEQVEIRDQEITKLKDELVRKNLQITGLEEIINSMTSTVSNLSSAIDQKDAALNTAYFRMATKKTLQSDGIIDRKGDVVPDINPMFQVVDVTTFTEIPVFASKADILTSHPADSYEIVGDKKQVEKLIIKDPQAFWSAQKFLVIQVKY